MHVLSWPHKRHQIVTALTSIEPSIGQRAEAMTTAWTQLREDGLFQPEEKPEERNTVSTPIEETVPDYLR